jgi:hypothetical protein
MHKPESNPGSPDALSRCGVELPVDNVTAELERPRTPLIGPVSYCAEMGGTVEEIVEWRLSD